MRRRTFRTSFVVTIAGSVVQSAGCGGSTTDHDHDPSTGGRAETGGQHSTGGAGGATGGRVATGGGPQGTGGTLTTGGTTGLDACPSGSVYTTPAPVCPASGQCGLAVHCAGGETLLQASCTNPHAWSTETPCENPYDHCAVLDQNSSYRTATCYDHTWHLEGIGGNPPSPCAGTAPVPNSPCHPSGFGGDREFCGYPCAPTSANPEGWSVYHCAPEQADAAPPTYSWQPDGNCERGPNGD